jgi:hypothetical protein
MPEIDTDKLIYFALSVFWRAGASKWRWRQTSAGIDLGPYLEPMRSFLLGESGFLENAALMVRVMEVSPIRRGIMLPETANLNGVHSHTFAMAGFGFLLAVGETDATRHERNMYRSCEGEIRDYHAQSRS